MPTAKDIKSIARLMKNGEPRNEKKIKDAMRWTHIIDITRNGVVDMISAIVWFGIGCICGAMMLVAYSVITFDERKKKQKEVRLRGTNVPHQPTVPKMMTDLESAIKHCEEVVERERKRLEFYQEHNMPEYFKSCKECEEEHRQLAKWLKELKIHREIHDVLLQLLVDFDLDICCDDLMDNEKEQKICEENCDNKTKGCWVRWAKLKAREANADEKL